VYRARDTKLKREVALKILPTEFALDPDRVVRFKREGRVLASLHPNVGAIETTSGRPPLVARGNDFQAVTASPLFRASLPATTFGDLNFLAVSRDGSRFFIPEAVEQPESDVIRVRVGWAK
jgi:serine/threonine protein kinase